MDIHDIPYLTTLRAELVRSIERSNRRRSRILLTSRVAIGAAAAASVAVAGFSLLGTGGPGTPSADAAVLRNVRVAVTPPAGTILHERAINTLGDLRWAYELWQSSDGAHAYRVVKGPTEADFNGSAVEMYDAKTNTIRQEQPTDRTRTFEDPVSDLRALLDNGGARIVGTSTIGGRDVLQIEAHSSSNMLFNGTIYVDAASYQPVLAEVQQSGYDCGRSTPCAGLERIRFVTYEYLPATAANLPLLSVSAQHPGATVAAADTTTTKG